MSDLWPDDHNTDTATATMVATMTEPLPDNSGSGRSRGDSSSSAQITTNTSAINDIEANFDLQAFAQGLQSYLDAMPEEQAETLRVARESVGVLIAPAEDTPPLPGGLVLGEGRTLDEWRAIEAAEAAKKLSCLTWSTHRMFI